MVTSRAWFRWAVGSFLMIGLCACSQSVEDFCNAWAEASCQTTTDCCAGTYPHGTADCKSVFSSRCLERMEIESLRAGKGTFDSDAANACFPALSCEMRPPEDAFAAWKACANAYTGVEPLGGACLVDQACARAGELSVCYRHKRQAILETHGVCAAVVIDQEVCAFSNDDHTLRLCPEDKYCDIGASPPDASAADASGRPSAYSAPCLDKVAAGASCIDPRTTTGLLPCQEGLYCEVTGTNVGTCVAQKPEGAGCRFDFGVQECEGGLTCTKTQGESATCEPVDWHISICPVATNECGDGFCDRFSETPSSCPSDCQSCFDCACHWSQSFGGCREVCDQNASGGEVADFCNWAPAQPRCEQCIQIHCNNDSSSCGI